MWALDNSAAESAAKDAPVLTCIYFQRLLCSDELFRPDITVLVDWA